jgi:hypothetical protein
MYKLSYNSFNILEYTDKLQVCSDRQLHTRSDERMHPPAQAEKLKQHLWTKYKYFYIVRNRHV